MLVGEARRSVADPNRYSKFLVPIETIRRPDVKKKQINRLPGETRPPKMMMMPDATEEKVRRTREYESLQPLIATKHKGY